MRSPCAERQIDAHAPCRWLSRAPSALTTSTVPGGHELAEVHADVADLEAEDLLLPRQPAGGRQLGDGGEVGGPYRSRA